MLTWVTTIIQVVKEYPLNSWNLVTFSVIYQKYRSTDLVQDLFLQRTCKLLQTWWLSYLKLKELLWIEITFNHRYFIWIPVGRKIMASYRFCFMRIYNLIWSLYYILLKCNPVWLNSLLTAMSKYQMLISPLHDDKKDLWLITKKQEAY